MIELVLANHDGDVIEVATRGTISTRHMSPDDEPWVALLGPGAFSCRVMLNLGESDFIDSSGIGWLLQSHKKFQHQGGRVALYEVPPLILQVLHTMQLEQVLDLTQTRADAKQKVREEQA